MTVQGKIIPIKDGVIITDMEFGQETTKSGIVMPSTDGKSEGIKPRWGRVYAVGPDQHNIKVGDWILVEHGRWTRGIEVEENGSKFNVRRVEVGSIMLTSDEKPNDTIFGLHATPEHGSVHSPQDFINL